MLLLAQSLLSADVAGQPTYFSDEAVLTGLLQPISMTSLPDGRILLLQKIGRILIVDPTTSPAQSAIYMQLSNINTGGERGLIDIALHPDFASNGYFYLYYHPASPQRGRISRFRHFENSGGTTSTGQLASELMVWQEGGPAGYGTCCHFGGGLDFGPDGKLYLTVGDRFDDFAAQDPRSTAGSIVRINDDGSIPSDNPYVGNPNNYQESIWAIGLRNPFRASWDLPTGRFFIGEVGGNHDPTSYEDLHVARTTSAGVNFGWPYCEGYSGNPDFPDCDPQKYDEPIFAYPHSGTGASITGGVVYRGSQFPTEFQGAYFYGDYVRQWIRYLTFDPQGTAVTGDHEFIASAGPVVAIDAGMDGSLYYIRIDGSLRRVRYEFSDPPNIDFAEASPTSGDPPLTVQFSASASGGSGALSYAWTLGDGQFKSGSSVSHTYTSTGVYTAYLVVSDGTHSSSSDPIRIQVGSAGQARIESPANGTAFRAGDVIHFSGSASGASETLPITEGLRLHLQADEGVIAQGGSVTSWIDLSGNGNSLTASGGPVVTSTPSGVPAVRLDGLNDKLARTSAVSGMPGGNSDRTVIQVVRYHGASAWAGFAYGRGAPNQAFGLAVTNSGPNKDRLMVQGWGGPHDMISGTVGIGAGWMIQSAVVSNNSITHFKGTTAIGSGTRTYDTVVDQVVLGAEISGLGFVQMDVGAVLVYDRALSHAERQNVVEFLNRKYLTGETGPSEAELSWVVKFGHNDHFHPVLGPLQASSGSFNIPTSGHDYSSNTWYNIHLTATLGNGLSDTTSVNVYPDKVDVEFSTSPAGIPVYIDGVPRVAPFILDDLIGFQHNVSVPESRCIDGTGYAFSHWSDGGARERTVTVPATNATFAAVYTLTGGCDHLAAIPGAVNFGEVESGESAEAVVTLLNSSPEDISVSNISVSNPAFGIDDTPNPPFIIGASGGSVTATLTFTPSAVGEVVGTMEVAHSGGNSPLVVEIRGEGVQGGPPDPLPVTQGLALRLESDLNVVVSGDVVSSWKDASGRGNDLSASGGPRLVPSLTPSGMAAIALDGVDDKLTRASATSGLPAGASDRTMFAVVRYKSASAWAGVAYGNGAQNQAFGLAVAGSGAKKGSLMVQGWGAQHDLTSSSPGIGAGWLVHHVTVSGSTVQHFRDNSLVQTGSRSYNTATNKISIGEEIAQLGFVSMDLGAVLLYDRALTNSERTAVYNYLQNKYFESSSQIAGVSIESPSAGATIVGSEVAMTWVATAASAGDQVQVALDDGPFINKSSLNGSHTFVDVPPGNRILKARIVNAQGQPYPNPESSDEVVFVVEGVGTPTPPLARDDRGMVSPGQSVRIPILANDVGISAHLDVSSVNIIDPPSYGQVVVDQATGDVTYSHSGSTPVQDGFSYVVKDASGLTSNVASVTVHAMAGLVLHLESTQALQLSGPIVMAWADLSGQGNHLTQNGNPTLLDAATPSGKRAVRLDGEDDRLLRSSGLSGLPAGSSNRSLFAVVRYNSAKAWGGLAYGSGNTNQAFGLGVVASGANKNRLMVQGWGPQHDFISTTAGIGAGWMLHAATVSGNTVTHFKDGLQIGTATRAYNTHPQKIVIGQEIAELGFVGLDVAAVLLFDRALSTAERQTVQAYLNETYLTLPDQPDQLAMIDQDRLESDETATRAVPQTFVLRGNFPNPFRGQTDLVLDLPSDAEVDVDVYDVLGRRVHTATRVSVSAGAGQRVTVSAESFASGLYFYTVTARSTSMTYTGSGKLIVVR